MTQSVADKVLTRKAQAARRAIEAQGMSVEKAFRRALARTAEEAWNLALIARNARQTAADQEETAQRLEEGDLIVLLDGPDGALGFALFDRQAVTGLVEVQTLGIVTDMAPDERRMTPTDAAIAAPLIEGTLGRLVSYLGVDPLAAMATGYRFGAMVESARIAANLLSAPRYRLLEADLDLGGGIRQGRIVVALPEQKRPVSAAAEDAPPEPRHAALMLSLPAQVDAVLCRLRLPFSEARALAPGVLLPLPAKALDQAELVGPNGVRITSGRLGQLGGLRAIRVTDVMGAGPRLGGVRLSSAEDETAPDLGEWGPVDRGASVEAARIGYDAPGGFGPSDTARPDAHGTDRNEFEAEDDLPELPPLDFGFAAGDLEEGDTEEGDDPLEGLADFGAPLSSLDGPGRSD